MHAAKPTSTSFDDLAEKLDNVLSHGAFDGDLSQYRSRLAAELDIIRERKLADYFWLISDIVDLARSRNMPLGPGRGFAPNSLACYLLGLSDIDPVAHKLPHDPFYGCDPFGFPEIVIEVGFEFREELVNLCSEKYGTQNVGRVPVFQRSLASSQVMGTDRVQNWRANKLQGHIKEVCLHSCAIVISREPLALHFSIANLDSKGLPSPLAEKPALQQKGLPSIDIMGLREVSIVKNAKELIANNHGVTPTFSSSDCNDAATHELIASGDTDNVFQLQSKGMRRLCGRVQPASLDELAALAVLDVANDASMIEDYVESHRWYPNADDASVVLLEVLDSTRGCVLYVEQVFRILRELAGFTHEETQRVIDCVRAKDFTTLRAWQRAFEDGILERLSSLDDIDLGRLWNRTTWRPATHVSQGHRLAYAYLSYQMAYLKTHFSHEFCLAIDGRE